MAGLRVYGTVGKATVSIMTDAILQSAAAATEIPADAPTALVLLDADEQGMRALAASGRDVAVVANGDLVPASRLPASALSFGLGRASTLWASDLDATLEGTSFTLNSGSGQHRVRLQLLGEHQVMNALAALGVALTAGIPQDVAITALEGIASLGRGRMQRMDAPGGMIVINDTVSAQPQSVVAALKALVQVAGQRRSVAVLGELSLATDSADATRVEDARAAHDRIGRLVVRLNVKKLVVVGQGARHIHNAAGLEGSWDGESVLVDTTAEAYDLLRDELRPQDVVLVKSAESSSLDALAEQLSGALL